MEFLEDTHDESLAGMWSRLPHHLYVASDILICRGHLFSKEGCRETKDCLLEKGVVLVIGHALSKLYLMPCPSQAPL